MRIIRPHYYDEFRCVADKCPDTCCEGWQIVIDDESLERYGEEKGVYGRELADRIDWQESCFRQYGGRCACLDDNNLCKLVLEKGEEYLCNTCHRYPRHEEEFEGQREWSLSLSCPIAANMILLRNEPVQFLVEENDEPDPLEEEFEDFDFLLFTKLEDAREVMISIAQNRNVPMEKRMVAILKLAKQIQNALDDECLFDMDDIIEQALARNEEWKKPGQHMAEELRMAESTQYEMIKDSFGIFYELEQLRAGWQQVLSETESILYKDEKEYRKIRSEFELQYGPEGALYEDWECFQENLLLFFVFTYFCGAVYDDWIYSKAALAVFSVKYITEFIMGRWYLSDKKIEKSQWVLLAYQYAREVEHSDENLNRLEEWLMEEGQKIEIY